MGSYDSGAIDTIDLATGNLLLNIPLISFPQRGSLPPLSFSVELNNAPYSQSAFNCDPADEVDLYPETGDVECKILSSRYDTSPPGAVIPYQAQPFDIQSSPGPGCPPQIPFSALSTVCIRATPYFLWLLVRVEVEA